MKLLLHCTVLPHLARRGRPGPGVPWLRAAAEAAPRAGPPARAGTVTVTAGPPVRPRSEAAPGPGRTGGPAVTGTVGHHMMTPADDNHRCAGEPDSGRGGLRRRPGRSGPPASDSKARPTARARALPGIAESTSVSAAHLRRARAGHESESFHRPGSESRVISHVARARSAAAVTVADVTQASSMSTVAVTVTTESGTQARGLPGNGLAVRLSRNRRTAAAAVRADSEAALGRIRQRAESP